MLRDSVKCLLDKMFLRKHFVKCSFDTYCLFLRHRKKGLNGRNLRIKCL